MTLFIPNCKTDESKLSRRKAHQWVPGLGLGLGGGSMGHKVTQETFWNNGNILYFEIGVVLQRYVYLLKFIQLYT